jgi:hypothetical protein
MVLHGALPADSRGKPTGFGDDPFTRLLTEGKRAKGEWPILRSGLFGGSYERFEKAAADFRVFMAQLPFH